MSAAEWDPREVVESAYRAMDREDAWLANRARRALARVEQEIRDSLSADTSAAAELGMRQEQADRRQRAEARLRESAARRAQEGRMREIATRTAHQFAIGADLMGGQP